MRKFETKSIDEVIPATVDYPDETALNVIAQVISMSVMSGVDATPDNMRQGVAQATGGIVIQLLKDGVIGVQYNAHCLATFGDGSKLARDYRFKVKAVGT